MTTALPTFTSLDNEADRLDDAEFSTAVFLPWSYHTLTARFVRTPIASNRISVSVWDEDGDHRETMNFKRADVLLLEQFVAQCKEFVT